MSQMLVIAKKFKEILKPEHRNTVWRCPKEYLLATVKTVRKCVKPEGRSPRTNIKSWSERFGHTGKAAVQEQQVELLRSQSVQQECAGLCTGAAGCHSNNCFISPFFTEKVCKQVINPSNRVKHTVQLKSTRYFCSFFPFMSLKSWTRKGFSSYLCKRSKIKAMTFTTRTRIEQTTRRKKKICLVHMESTLTAG